MGASTQDFCSLLVRSRLASDEEVRTLAETWRSDAGDKAEDGEKFAKWLTGREVLTGYQAALLLRGRADHFFLDQYKLLERIGTGRMAGVFKAVHRLGQVVAIKVLPPSKAKIEEALVRFQREARLSVRLRHPNVVRTYQMGQALGLYYLVMEYLEGETLEEVLKRRGRLPPAEAARILHQAFQGLQHLHEHGIVHRDLKPGNLMLVPLSLPGQDNTLEATVKILDIGLGRSLFDENDPWGAAENFQLTTEGSILGEPDYLAPEQARDAHAADIRADIYSLGATFFHALAGHPPFPDSNRVRQLVRHATEAPRPLRELNLAVPEGLQAVVNRLLAKDPAQRPGTPQQAAQCLEPFLPGDRAQRPARGPMAVQSYLDYVEREPATREAEMIAPPTAASVHTWGSLFMKIPPEEAASLVYGVAAQEPLQRQPPPIRTAARPELLPSVKKAAAPSAKLEPSRPHITAPAPAPRQPEPSSPARAPATVPALSKARASRKEEGPPVAAARPQPRQTEGDEQAQAARTAPRSRTGANHSDDRPEPDESTVELVKARMSRREIWLVMVGIALGAGAIVVAGVLGILLSHAWK
ncbi:MAG TPA: protein kinase [Gemmataceae bacterium]|nr:protein kinase [Gemmataceae bacterium]